MDAAWAAGITTFDTADAYGGGRSETFIGNWIRSRGVRPVLTTKTFNPMERGRRQRALSRADPAAGRDEPRAARRRAHRPVPLARDGSGDADRGDRRGLRRAPARGHDRRLGRQQRRRRLGRGRRARPGCRTPIRCSTARTRPASSRSAAATGIGYTPFGPLAGGWLTGKYRRGEEPPAGSRMTLRPEAYEHLRSDRTFDALEAFEAVRDDARDDARRARARLAPGAAARDRRRRSDRAAPSSSSPRSTRSSCGSTADEADDDRGGVRMSAARAQRGGGRAAPDHGRLHRGDGRRARLARARTSSSSRSASC